MADGIAISASGVGKTYKIRRGGEAHITAAEAALEKLRHPLRRRAEFEEFHALNDLDFEIPWGEAVGVLGRNGAGKSTLLKILTRVAAPTRGRIVLGGRVGSLLEVGTGFHPELTGRENVFLNGTLLGMRRKEIRARFDEIVAFSGVEKFLDTPVKRYSSGMYVRLAFSVAAHLETEILAIDEVLAVGDAEFQGKCIEKMRSASSQGRTVLYVSHQIQTVTALCTSALFLDRGQLTSQGSVEDCVLEYQQSYQRSGVDQQDANRRSGTGELRLLEVEPTKDVYSVDSEKRIRLSVGRNADFIGDYFVSCHIVNSDGMIVLQCDSRMVGYWYSGNHEQHVELAIRSPWLKPGRYTVDAFVCKAGILDAWEHATSFEVLPILPYEHATSSEGIESGLVLADFTYERVV